MFSKGNRRHNQRGNYHLSSLVELQEVLGDRQL